MPVADGSIASTVLTPDVLGYKRFDLYDALSKPGGDDAALGRLICEYYKVAVSKAVHSDHRAVG